MALISVRPSRGSWAFFTLVTLAALGSRAWRRHEATVIRRDGPAAQAAQNLALCLLGPDVNALLPDDAQEPVADEWTFRIGEWLRAASAARQPAGWPGRCVPLIDGLETRLRRTRTARPQTYAALSQLRSILERVDGPGAELARVSDDNSLPSSLATALADVRSLSLGTQDRWQPVIPVTGRWPAPRLPEKPRFHRSFPRGADRVVLASAGCAGVALVARRDDPPARARRQRVARRGGGPRGAPRRARARGLLAGRDRRGPALVTPGPVARAIPLPTAVVPTRGDALAGYGWDVTRANGRAVFVGLDGGTLRAASAPLDGPVSWTPPVEVGHAESVLAATVSAEPEGPRVTTLRPRATDLVLEAYRLRAGDDPRQAMAVEDLGVHRMVAASDAREALTCAAGPVRWIAVVGEPVTFFRVEGASVTAMQGPDPSPTPARPLSLRCDGQRALLFARGEANAPASLLLASASPDGVSAANRIAPAPIWGEARVWDLGLVDGAVLALVQDATTLRAWRWTEETPWAPAAFVASLTPGRRARRAFTRVALASEGDDAMLVLEGTLTDRVAVRRPATDETNGQPQVQWTTTVRGFRTVAVSGDRGETFSTR
ncbi:MAG: hypothetical protein R3A52_10510 [Polyangiales bacterium]